MSDFRYIPQVNPEPKKVLKQINNILCERSYRGIFTTAVFYLLDMNNRMLTDGITEPRNKQQKEFGRPN
jgi:serine phosphatase RsbU (regulator of sigma subunit)